MYLLQDWQMVAGNGTTSVVQSLRDWADLARFSDAYFWLEVRAVQNPGGGSVTLRYETAPLKESVLFQPVASVTLAAGTAPVISKVRLFDNPTVPLAQWMRWSLQGTTAGDWSATFRIFVSGGPALSRAFDPSALNLTGWWRASYAGSPWSPTPSAGASGSNGNLSDASPPGVGAAVNGFASADFNGSTNKLDSAVNTTSLWTTGAGAIAVLFNADTAGAPAFSAYDDPPLATDPGARFALTYTSSGIRATIFKGTWVTTPFIACPTGAWHWAFAWWDATNLYVQLDTGSPQSVAIGGTVNLGTAVLRVGENWAALARFDGKILELFTQGTAWTANQQTSIVQYGNDRYGLSL